MSTKTSNKYSFTLPDGYTITRNSVRELTHMVAVLEGPEDGRPGWGFVSVHGNKVLALKSQAKWAPAFIETRIIEAN